MDAIPAVVVISLSEEAAPRALRCPDHVTDAAAFGLTIEDSRLSRGLLLFWVFLKKNIYLLSLTACKLFLEIFRGCEKTLALLPRLHLSDGMAEICPATAISLLANEINE